MNIVVLAPLFLPPPEYFKIMKEADSVVIDTAMSYDKRFKTVHRTVVSAPHGPSFLTVPVSTPGTSRCRWESVKVSGHGEWWRVQKSTMSTLYGPTPYFDLYKHDIFPFFNEDAVGQTITDLDIRLIVALRRLAGITTPMSVTLDPRYLTDADVSVTDLRKYDFYSDERSRSVIEKLFHEGGI